MLLLPRGGVALLTLLAWATPGFAQDTTDSQLLAGASLTEITKAQLLALRLGRIKDEGKLDHTMVSMAKRNNVDVALQIARLARDLLGANGIVDDYQAMRHMVNLETVRTYEGTHDVHTLILGEHITGMRAL